MGIKCDAFAGITQTDDEFRVELSRAGVFGSQTTRFTVDGEEKLREILDQIRGLLDVESKTYALVLQTSDGVRVDKVSANELTLLCDTIEIHLASDPRPEATVNIL